MNQMTDFILSNIQPKKNFAHRSVGSSIYRISNGLSVYRSIAFQSIVLLRASCPRGENTADPDLPPWALLKIHNFIIQLLSFPFELTEGAVIMDYIIGQVFEAAEILLFLNSIGDLLS